MWRQPTGTLEVKAYGVNEAEPIRGARVIVAVRSNGTERTLATVMTDDAGNAPSITLPAPASGSATAYAVYIVTVEANGYQTKRIEGVQVFANQRALQHVQMNRGGPVYGYAAPMPPVPDVIPPHALVGNYPPGEEEPPPAAPPAPYSFGPIAAPMPPRPVVLPPEIIVHMGPPDRPGANIKVPMLDYLRKVASGELDPNAHVEAKRANAIALISFTLNRIYTDRYMGLGKDFHITNVTNPDHLFHPSQTMQASIVDVVDDIVGQFVGTRGQMHPILAQYYNIKKVGYYMPNRLEQSEADRLARRGVKHIELLRRYYEPKYKPVELRTAQRIGQGTESFPGQVLRRGSSGPAVETVQGRLNVIKQKSYPAIPKVPEDGVYGASTEQAVKVFQQKVLGIAPTGVVDRRTWYRIGHYYWSALKILRTDKERWVPVLVPMWVRMPEE